MTENQTTCVQHLALGLDPDDFRKTFGLRLPVGVVTEHGETEVLEMDADLVGATGVELGLDECRAREPFKPGPGCACVLSTGDDGHAFAVGGVPRDGGAEFTRGGFEITAQDRLIEFFNEPHLELGVQPGVGAVILGNDETARRTEVETMDDAWTFNASDSAEFARAVVEQGVDEGSVVMTGGGVHDQFCRLVEDDEIRVLVQDVERDVLGDEFRGPRRGPEEGDDIAGTRRLGGFDEGAVDLDAAFEDEALDGGAGNVFEESCQMTVQAFAREALFEDEGVGLRHVQVLEVRRRDKTQVSAMPAMKVTTLADVPGVNAPARGLERNP